MIGSGWHRLLMIDRPLGILCTALDKFFRTQSKLRTIGEQVLDSLQSRIDPLNPGNQSFDGQQ